MSAPAGHNPDHEQPAQLPNQRTGQFELHPRACAKGSIAVCDAMPSETRSFGKLVDVEPLKAGDVLLTREDSPGFVSQGIEQVQCRGGYDKRDSQWTHAGVYVGHGKVVEANLLWLFGGRVRMQHLWDWSHGQEVLRFRRPKHATSEAHRVGIATHAMERLNQRYPVCEVCRGMFGVLVRGRSFYQDYGYRRRRPAMTCAGLYADAYSKVTRRILVAENGVCTPALLSASDEFEDIEVSWLNIA